MRQNAALCGKTEESSLFKKITHGEVILCFQDPNVDIENPMLTLSHTTNCRLPNWKSLQTTNLNLMEMAESSTNS